MLIFHSGDYVTAPRVHEGGVMDDKSWIKKHGRWPVVVQEFMADKVVVTIDGTSQTLPIEEWRALPVWDGPFPDV